MKETFKDINHEGKTFKLYFNLNVLEAIQDEYGTLDAWGALTDGSQGETNIKALLFGFREMINEGIEINNEKTGKNEPLLTKKQVGRILTDIGLDNVTKNVNDLVIESAGDDSKNE